MSSKTVRFSAAALAGGLAVGSAGWAASGSRSHGETESHDGHPALGAHADVLHVPAGAGNAERLELLRTDFFHRRHRIDWKSDSVVKRIRWALRDADRALAEGNAESASERLDDAQSLLEEY